MPTAQARPRLGSPVRTIRAAGRVQSPQRSASDQVQARALAGSDPECVGMAPLTIVGGAGLVPGVRSAVGDIRLPGVAVGHDGWRGEPRCSSDAAATGLAQSAGGAAGHCARTGFLRDCVLVPRRRLCVPHGRMDRAPFGHRHCHVARSHRAAGVPDVGGPAPTHVRGTCGRRSDRGGSGGGCVRGRQPGLRHDRDPVVAAGAGEPDRYRLARSCTTGASRRRRFSGRCASMS